MPDHPVPQPAVAESPAATVVAIVLAAGGGTRFLGPTHKLDAVLDASGGDPRTLLQRAVDAAIDSGIGPVIVVTGAPIHSVLPAGIEVVENPAWEHGQLTSLRRGLDAAACHHATAAVVGLGDQPFVTPEAWRAVAAAAPDIAIAVATYLRPDGTARRGNPVRLRADVWPLLDPETNPPGAPTGSGPDQHDHGARRLMRLRPELVGEVPCPAPALERDADIDTDIDTLEDLARWQNNSSTNSP